MKSLNKSNNKTYNVIIYDINSNKMTSYDVIPYFIREYNNLNKKQKAKIKNFDDLKNFVKAKAMYQFWARCEYEIILSDWPPSGKIAEKWDVYDQIILNINFVTEALANNIDFKYY